MLSCIREIAQYWEQVLQPEHGAAMPWDLQQTLLAGLRLNVLEVNRYLHGSRPTLHQFEAWVLECNGGVIEEARLERLQRAMAGMAIGSEVGLFEGVEGLSESDLEQWDEHGYVVLKNAVTAQAAEAAELAIYEYLGMSAHDSESWYTEKLGHSIWVPLLRHPALVANRYAPRIVKAFAQLWGCEDLGDSRSRWVESASATGLAVSWTASALGHNARTAASLRRSGDSVSCGCGREPGRVQLCAGVSQAVGVVAERTARGCRCAEACVGYVAHEAHCSAAWRHGDLAPVVTSWSQPEHFRSTACGAIPVIPPDSLAVS